MSAPGNEPPADDAGSGVIFSTESPPLLNSKDTKGGWGEGIHGKKK